MPIVLDATVGGANANTYALAAAADAWAEADANGAAWLALTADQKTALAARSARLLDDSFVWAGKHYTITQARAWPRYPVEQTAFDGGYYLTTEIPRAVSDAQVELMIWLASQGVTADAFAATSGLVALSVGPISLNYGTRAPASAGETFLVERLAPKLRAAGLLGTSSSAQVALTR